MYEQQKRKIIAEYLLSPRCYRSVKSKPNRQFSSWKNHLNPDVAHLSNKINAAKNQYYGYAGEASPTQRQKRTEAQAFNFHQKTTNRRNLIQLNTDYFSKLDTAVKTPKTYQTQQYSRSSLTGKTPRIQKDKMSLTSIQLKDQSLKSNDKTLESPNCMDQDIFMQIKDQLMDNPQILGDGKNSNWEKNNEISQYHRQLKEEQRAYLLQKFMQHYEKIHKFKL